MEEKYRTCRHAEHVEEFAVYVKASCPNRTRIHGRDLSCKTRCKRCGSWQGKGEGS